MREATWIVERMTVDLFVFRFIDQLFNDEYAWFWGDGLEYAESSDDGIYIHREGRPATEQAGMDQPDDDLIELLNQRDERVQRFVAAWPSRVATLYERRRRYEYDAYLFKPGLPTDRDLVTHAAFWDLVVSQVHSDAVEVWLTVYDEIEAELPLDENGDQYYRVATGNELRLEEAMGRFLLPGTFRNSRNSLLSAGIPEGGGRGKAIPTIDPPTAPA